MALTLHVGTSGYSYKEWQGRFYPEGLPAAHMLRHYATQLSAVEINNTFYRMPSASTLEKWRTQAPAPFVFAIKAPQQITHAKRLKEVEAPLAHLETVTQALGPQRGPILFQLPPYLKKDVPRLTAFLAALPAGMRACIEFRHASWFDDAVYGVLEAHGAALCLADTDDEALRTPRQVTAKWGYARLRRAQYAPKTLQLWLAWMQAQAWDEVFVFFKHEDAATGPALAHDLLRLWRA